MQSYERQIRDNIKKLVSDSQFYENNTECPTCSQSISEETRSSKISECKHSAQELNHGYDKLKESLSQTSEEIQTVSTELQRLNALQSKIHSNQNLIVGLEKRVADCTRLLSTQHEASETVSAHTALENLHLENERLQELKASQLEERMYNEAIGELLKDTGIKTKIIRQYLPIMNKLINHYLQVLDFFVLFTLDENFTETIRSRHRDDFSYSSFSEGEKRRIDLSLLFAWRAVAQQKNSLNCNLLIFDEVLDGSLDDTATEYFLNILKNLGKNTNVFVISHKSKEVLQDKFVDHLTFIKKNNFSKLA